MELKNIILYLLFTQFNSSTICKSTVIPHPLQTALVCRYFLLPFPPINFSINSDKFISIMSVGFVLLLSRSVTDVQIRVVSEGRIMLLFIQLVSFSWFYREWKGKRQKHIFADGIRRKQNEKLIRNCRENENQSIRFGFKWNLNRKAFTP